VLLPLGVVAALLWVNLDATSYYTFSLRAAFLVNDVAMAFFFALITQEVVEAVMPGGALHSWRRWGLPIAGAIGGIVGSVAVYLTWVYTRHETVLVGAWPIATAVDVAAAYYVLKAIDRRSPLLPFVLLLGIATNAFGLAVVAFQRPIVETRSIGTVLLAIALAAAMLLRARKAPKFWPYLAVCAATSWWALYWMGVHPALAFLPIVPLLPHEARPRDVLATPPADDATHRFEHEWADLVQVILFFFGLVNGGVLLRTYDTGTWAILLASLLGRPAGVLVGIGLAAAAGLHLPARVGFRDIVVAALATTSGFTFALFFAAGLIPVGPILEQITLGALATSAGVLVTLAAARVLGVGAFARRHAPEFHGEKRAQS
jgi:NhaA family Na+:H+ antiporter